MQDVLTGNLWLCIGFKYVLPVKTYLALRSTSKGLNILIETNRSELTLDSTGLEVSGVYDEEKRAVWFLKLYRCFQWSEFRSILFVNNFHEHPPCWKGATIRNAIVPSAWTIRALHQWFDFAGWYAKQVEVGEVRVIIGSALYWTWDQLRDWIECSEGAVIEDKSKKTVQELFAGGLRNGALIFDIFGLCSVRQLEVVLWFCSIIFKACPEEVRPCLYIAGGIVGCGDIFAMEETSWDAHEQEVRGRLSECIHIGNMEATTSICLYSREYAVKNCIEHIFDWT